MTKNQISGYIDTPIDLESSLCGGQSFRWMIKNKRFRGVNIYPFRPGYDLQEWWVPNSMMMYTK